jgi:hypothetical protein
MADLTEEQLQKIEAAVNAAGRGKFTFEHAAATDAGKKLAIVAVYRNDGELNTAVVKAGDDANWQSNPEQFDAVLQRAVRKL